MLKHEPAMQDSAAGRSHVVQFAMKVFLAADNEDRSGAASKYYSTRPACV